MTSPFTANDIVVFEDATGAKVIDSGVSISRDLVPTPQQFGAVGDNVHDDTTAITAWLNAAMTNGRGYLPPGIYKITSQLPVINRAVHLVGAGLNSSVLLGNYNRVGNTGIIAFTDGSNGSYLGHMAIETVAGTSGGSVVSLIGLGVTALEGIVLDSLWLTTTGSNTHLNTVYIDGSAQSSGAIGCRACQILNCDIFGASGYSLFMKSAIACVIDGTNISAAGGTSPASGGFQLTGTVGVPSEFVNAHFSNLNSGINLTNCLFCYIEATAIGAVSGLSVGNDATVSNVMVKGTVSGTINRAWVSSAFEDMRGVKQGAVSGGHYYLYPGGVVEIWMTGSTNNAGVTFTFPYTFQSPPDIQATITSAASLGTSDVAHVSSITNTNCIVDTNNVNFRNVTLCVKGLVDNAGFLPIPA